MGRVSYDTRLPKPTASVKGLVQHEVGPKQIGESRCPSRFVWFYASKGILGKNWFNTRSDQNTLVTVDVLLALCGFVHRKTYWQELMYFFVGGGVLPAAGPLESANEMG